MDLVEAKIGGRKADLAPASTSGGGGGDDDRDGEELRGQQA
jgi:hypothetical protein